MNYMKLICVLNFQAWNVYTCMYVYVRMNMYTGTLCCPCVYCAVACLLTRVVACSTIAVMYYSRSYCRQYTELSVDRTTWEKNRSLRNTLNGQSETSPPVKSIPGTTRSWQNLQPLLMFNSRTQSSEHEEGEGISVIACPISVYYSNLLVEEAGHKHQWKHTNRPPYWQSWQKQLIQSIVPHGLSGLSVLEMLGSLQAFWSAG